MALTGAYLLTYASSVAEVNAPASVDRQLGSMSIVDLLGRYTGLTDLTVRLGIRNLMDRTPRWALCGSFQQVGHSPSSAAPRGRIFYGSRR